MLPGPMIRRELRTSAQGASAYILRTILASVLGAMVLLIIMSWHDGETMARGAARAEDVRAFGTGALFGTVGIELIVLIFIVPTMVSATIAGEQARGTLGALLLTRLSRTEIVLAKLVGRLPQVLAPVAVGLPLVLIAADTGSTPLLCTLLIVAATVSTAVLVTSVSLLTSARAPTPAQAGSQAFVFNLVWLIGLPVAAVVPTAWAGRWSAPVDLMQGACALVAPASPLNVVIEVGRTGMFSYDWLMPRLGMMIALQAALSGLALFGAISSLDARERGRAANPVFQLDPYHGYRPACRDDPIVWREYELPTRRGSLPKILIWARYLWYHLRYFLFLLKVSLLVLSRVALALLVLGLQIGCVALAIALGLPAFQELWQYGYASAGAFHERTVFNVFVRGATALFGFVGLVGVVAAAAGRITMERDKGTWAVFLTTPLTGPEIVRSKMHSAFAPLRTGLKLVAVIWIAGAICGAIHPIGIVVAGLDLGLALWAGIALGLRIGLRVSSTSSANTIAALVSLGNALVHGTLILGPLGSIAEYREWSHADYRLRWAVYTIVAGALLLTAALAHRWTRQISERFDEWVGRPYRNAAAPVAEAAQAGGGAAPVPAGARA